TRKPKVGIVGEILVKYHPTANNDLIKILESEGAEVVISDLTDFLMYCAYNETFKHKQLAKSRLNKFVGDIAILYMEHYRKDLRKALEKSERFAPPLKIEELAKLAEEFVSIGNQGGEGWLLT